MIKLKKEQSSFDRYVNNGNDLHSYITNIIYILSVYI